MPGDVAPTVQTILPADKKIWEIIAESCTKGIVPQAAERPLEDAIEAAIKDPRVTRILMPREGGRTTQKTDKQKSAKHEDSNSALTEARKHQAALQRKLNEYTKRGKGKGKGSKHKTWYNKHTRKGKGKSKGKGKGKGRGKGKGKSKGKGKGKDKGKGKKEIRRRLLGRSIQETPQEGRADPASQPKPSQDLITPSTYMTKSLVNDQTF